MHELVIDRSAAAVVRDRIESYVDGRSDLTGLELYYELERATSLLTFHTMLRAGPRNRERSGLQQSYGDHNRLLMLGLDRLVAGDLEWYRDRIDPADPVGDDALHRCFDAVAALELTRQQLVALWLAAALHDCGMLCGRGAYVDVEDGVVLGRPILEVLCPARLCDLATAILRHHDYVKGVFLGEVPAAVVADDLATLPVDQQPLALAALGCVQIAGSASLGEGRLNSLRLEIFDRCADGSALTDRSRATRVERLVGHRGADVPVPDAFVDTAAVHGWHRVAATLTGPERVAVLVDVATWWADSGARHVVFADDAAPLASPSDARRLSRREETALSGVHVVVCGS